MNKNKRRIENRTARYLTRTLKLIALVPAAILIWSFIPYCICPVYEFQRTSPFEGSKYYNPYRDLPSDEWIKCNFHAHSYCWGGITYGKDAPADSIVSIYRKMGYRHVGISNYQKITRLDFDSDSIVSIPVYEHGYNIKKRHHLVLGADRVSWLDFLFWQDLSHKQFVLDNLRRDADFLAINHPQFAGGFLPEDFSRLSGYDAVEVLNHYRTSIAHWDSALSSGYYAVIAANDDMHNLHDLDETGICLTVASVRTANRQNIVDALRRGAHYGVRMKLLDDETADIRAERLRCLPHLVGMRMKGDTLTVEMNRNVERISFAGQGGAVRLSADSVRSASYVFLPDDTYVRVEVADGDDNLFLFNPVVRTNDNVVARVPRHRVALLPTALKYLAVGFCLAVCVLIWLRKKRIAPMERFRRWLSKPCRAGLLAVVFASLVLRTLTAVLLELTNDEVYYRLYALFPDWSHYDHPPMLGWMMQLFSYNLVFDNELSVRLFSLASGTATLILAFRIGERIHSATAGFAAVLLMAASPYMGLIVSTMAMPDTPLMFFWMLALHDAATFFSRRGGEQSGRNALLRMGLWIGLAGLSKYTAVFLWVGVGLYVLLYDRRTLASWRLYAAALLTAICFVPVAAWNASRGFVSFAFHGERVGFFDSFDPLRFLAEIAGEALYANPFVFVAVFAALIAGARQRGERNFAFRRLFVCIALPFLGTFWIASFGHRLLPHWTSPAYVTLIFPAAAFIARRYAAGRRKWFKAANVAVGVFAAIWALMVVQTKTDLFQLRKRGIQDFTSEISTWRKTGEIFAEEARAAEREGLMPAGAPIIATRWYPAANLEMYVALPSGRKVLTAGNIERTHKYDEITELRGGIPPAARVWFITDDYDFIDPEEMKEHFSEVKLYKTFTVSRCGVAAKEVRLYMARIKN
jgi:hypothetical protein